ncbi:unnamed protein product [Rotaria sp. Silwood2]|nr:unnamed protein product [Rotaria sp. Silwood2]
MELKSIFHRIISFFLGKICQRSFKTTVGHLTGYNSHPRSVTTGDMNNDTQLDIVVANSGTDNVGILYRYDNSTFASQITYSTGSRSQPYSVAVGDFNRDHLLDIEVANYGTNSIGILLPNGNGSFTSARLFSLGSSRPVSIVIADFNNDNILDLATANYDTSNVGVLLGYEDGSFGIHMTYSTGYDSLPYSVAVGDFNRDNRPDIAVINSGTSNVGIFLGHGNGSFGIQVTFSPGYHSVPYSVATTDVNSDDQLDIIVANYGSSSIGVLLRYGNGTLGMVRTYFLNSESHPSSVVVGDFNEDNEMDIAVANSNHETVVLLSGFKNGTVISQEKYSTGFGSKPSSIAVGDFNNDHHLDIAVANRDSNNIDVFLRYIYKPFTKQTMYSTEKDSQPRLIALGDFNNDSQVDFAVANYDSDEVVIFLGYGNGTFGKAMKYSSEIESSPKSIAVGDFNNDNWLDIAVAHYSPYNLALLIGYGNETFEKISQYLNEDESGLLWIIAGDFNNDKQIDIACVNYPTSDVVILLGNGNGTFRNGTLYSTGKGIFARSITVGDFNNGNQLDIATANYGTNSIGVLFGYENGTFAAVTTYAMGDGFQPLMIAPGYFNNNSWLDIAIVYPEIDQIGLLLGLDYTYVVSTASYPTGSGSHPYSISISDFNNDGTLDMAITNTGHENIGVRLGYDNGTFALETTYFIGSGSRPQYVTVGDFNMDNKIDIATANSGNDTISILYVYSDETSWRRETYSTGDGSQPSSLAIGDFNNDTRSDIVVTNPGTNSVGVFLSFNYVTFGHETIYATGFTAASYSLAIGDFNHDNQSDIVVANSERANIGIFLGYKNGTFSTQTKYSTGSKSKPQYVAIGDFNNDDHLDVVVVNNDKANIGIFLGYGNGTFAGQTAYSTGSKSDPYYVAIGDFDHDTNQDIVVAQYGTHNIGIFLGYGDGNFSTPSIYSTGAESKPASVTTGDLNNDSHLDIIVANYGKDNIGVLFGYGNATFSALTMYSTDAGSNPVCVTVIDINNDDQLDIVVVNEGTYNIGIFFGYGNGTFGDMHSYLMGYDSRPYSVAVGDFNNDSWIDMAVTNYGTDNVEIILQTC